MDNYGFDVDDDCVQRNFTMCCCCCFCCCELKQSFKICVITLFVM